MKPHIVIALLALVVSGFMLLRTVERNAEPAEYPPASVDMVSADEPCTCFAAVNGEDGDEHLRMSHPPRWLSEDEKQWCYVIGRGMDNDVFAICSPGVIGLLPATTKATPTATR